MDTDTLDNIGSTPGPLYKRVKRSIVKSLARGDWKPGESIPTERQLASRYDVGIATVRAAVGELVSAGVLVRMQGKGTFVAEHDESRIYRYFHVERKDGSKELPRSKLIWLRRATASPEQADILRLPRDESQMAVYEMRNILRIFGDPVVVSDITVPASLFPDLSEEIVTAGDQTLYAVYQKTYGISILRTREQLSAANVDESIATLLDLEPGTAVLEMRRIAYTYNSTPVEIRRSFIRTDNYHYLIEEGAAG
ncbi:MAG: GntR family transcriptional regulator [Aquisalimonadaceae bacterium]